MLQTRVALTFLIAALGASSCIFLVDEAGNAGAGGEGGAGGAGVAQSGVTGGGDGGSIAATTSSAGGGGTGGGGPLDIVVDREAKELQPGYVDRVARTPLSNDLPLLFAGGGSVDPKFIVVDQVAWGTPTTFGSLNGPGIALAVRMGQAYGIEPVGDTLGLFRPNLTPPPWSDPIGCSPDDPSISEVASVADGPVFARCGTHIARVPLDASGMWGTPTTVSTATNGDRTKIRTAKSASSGAVHVLWDDFESSDVLVRWCTYANGETTPDCSGQRSRTFPSQDLDDFGYSEEADTVFALSGVDLRGHATRGGAKRLFTGHAVHAFAVREGQIAFAYSPLRAASEPRIAVCFIDGQFVDAAESEPSPTSHCATLGLGAVPPPEFVLLTEDHVYTVTPNATLANGSMLRSFALQ